MRHNRTEDPPTKADAAALWGTLDDLCKKTRYWLYTRHQRARAQLFADRLENVLVKLPKNELAIVREEGLALLSELRGKISDAIVHRQKEIKLMMQLHDEARSPQYVSKTRKYMLRGRDEVALRKRQAILATLERQSAGDRHELLRKAQ